MRICEDWKVPSREAEQIVKASAREFRAIHDQVVEALEGVPPLRQEPTKFTGNEVTNIKEVLMHSFNSIYQGIYEIQFLC